MAPFVHFPWNKETLYTPVPSLEQIAAVQVTITLWNRADIRALIDEGQDAHLVEARVKCCARELVLSDETRDKVLSVIKPIGMQIFVWKHDFCCDNLLHKQLFWNVFGTIDQKRTAKAFVKDCTMSLELRYKTACAYCLEDDVINLWEQLSEESRDAFTPNSDSDDDDTDRAFPNELVSLWSRAMQRKGDLTKIFESLGISSDYWFLVFAVADCIQPAVEYFLPKLTGSAKRRFLLEAEVDIFRWTDIGFDSCGHESFFWLLLQMEEDQRKAAMAKNAIWVLIWCLDWPWQGLLLPIANRLKPFLSSADVRSLLININSKTMEGYRDYDYQQLFTKFWMLCPETAKRFVMKELATNSSLLTNLFSVGDKKSAQFILKDATDEELEKIVSYNRNFCLASQNDIPQNERSKNEVKMRWMCLFLLEFVVDEELNRRKIESNPSKKFRAANGCGYQHIFTKFWELSTETTQRRVMKEFASGCDLLIDLLSVGDKKNVQLILKSATDIELKNIISNYRKGCMALRSDPPKDGFSDGNVKMRWMGLLLLEFLVEEEFNNRKIEAKLC